MRVVRSDAEQPDQTDWNENPDANEQRAPHGEKYPKALSPAGQTLLLHSAAAPDRSATHPRAAYTAQSQPASSPEFFDELESFSTDCIPLDG